MIAGTTSRNRDPGARHNHHEDHSTTGTHARSFEHRSPHLFTHTNARRSHDGNETRQVRPIHAATYATSGASVVGNNSSASALKATPQRAQLTATVHASVHMVAVMSDSLAQFLVSLSLEWCRP